MSFSLSAIFCEMGGIVPEKANVCVSEPNGASASYARYTAAGIPPAWSVLNSNLSDSELVSGKNCVNVASSRRACAAARVSSVTA